MDLATINFIKFIGIFTVIIIVLNLKYTMHIAFFAAMLATAVFWQINPFTFLHLIWQGASAWDTISLVLIMYVITFLQRILEDKQELKNAQMKLYGIFNSRRVNATLAPVLIGLLPSAAVVTICGDIVQEACGDHLDMDEKTFLTSYYRHIPESIVPTFTTILIMATLTGLPLSKFMALTVPLAVALFAIGYFYYVIKVPKETGLPSSTHRSHDIIMLFKHLWTLAAIIVLILAFNVDVLVSCTVVSVLAYAYYGIAIKRLPEYIKRGFEFNIIVNMFCIMIFKEILNYTGAISTMPDFFSRFPLPSSLTFALIFFFGALISGSQAIATICTGIAFSTVPDAGIALMVLLHSFAYAAMQISPVHVCCAVIIEYFHTSFIGLVKKGIPVVTIFCIVSYAYYLFLTLVIGIK